MFSPASTLFRRGDLRFLGLTFGLIHDDLDRLFRKPTHLLQGVRLDHREIVVAQETFLHELFGQADVHPFELAETANRPIDRFGQFLLRHDLNVPARQLARQTNILAPSSDGQRQLIFADKHDGAAEHLTENHLFDFGRLQGVGDQDLQVVAPTHNIDPLASQLVHDVLNAIAPNADARADTIDPQITTTDRHLRTVARLAGHGPYFDHPVDNLRNLLFEQSLHQLGPDAAEDNSHATSRLANLEDRCPYAFIGMVRLAGDLLAAWQEGFDIRK